MNKVLGFWHELGISGFRVDSLQFMIETVGTSARDKPVSYLRSLVEFVERRRGDAIFLGEANVSPAEQQQYFQLDGGDGVQMLFDFRTCAAQWLAHARGSVVHMPASYEFQALGIFSDAGGDEGVFGIETGG